MISDFAIVSVLRACDSAINLGECAMNCVFSNIKTVVIIVKIMLLSIMLLGNDNVIHAVVCLTVANIFPVCDYLSVSICFFMTSNIPYGSIRSR